MQGVLIRLLDDKTGSPGRVFWPVFSSIRTQLDSFYWCFGSQPWMGPPAGFDPDVLLAFEGIDRTSAMLWRPHSLAEYAHAFAEECIDLWAMIRADDPPRLAAQFAKLRARDTESFIEEHARVRLSYCDRTCWEIYARDTSLVDAVASASRTWTSMKVYRSDSSDRGAAYKRAGLSTLWLRLGGE